jgi:hypothetical protein
MVDRDLSSRLARDEKTVLTGAAPNRHGRRRARLRPRSNTEAIITVGGGRGFIVEGSKERLVITAGHCLPHLPPAYADAENERIYPNLLAPRGAGPTIWAECRFLDPVADIAVLGSLDVGRQPEEAAAYDDLVDAVEPLPLGSLRWEEQQWPDGGSFKIPTLPEFEVCLLSLVGEWFRCTASRRSANRWPARPIWIADAAEHLRPGMSGSPIIDDGAAVGVFTTARGLVNPDALAGRAEELYREGGPNPHLVDVLPGWLLRELGLVSHLGR